MKKVLVFLLVLAFVVTGCSSLRTQNDISSQVDTAPESFDFRFPYDQPLTLDDVKLAFQQAGLILTENKESIPTDYTMRTVTPAIFSIKDSKQIIYVYVFDNIAERIKVVWEGGSLTKYSPPEFVTVPEGYLSATYTARNVLMVDLLDVRSASSIPSGEEQVLRTIDNTVNSLNNSQRMVLAAQSQYWDAQYLVEYYQHWYKDAAGVAHADQYSTGKWSVKYIGPNPESIQSIKYSYKTPTRGGSGDGIFKKDGDFYYLRMAGEDGSSSYPVSDGVYTLTITWNGHEETLDLKPICY